MIVVSLADLIISLVDQHAGQRAVIINAGIKLLFSVCIPPLSIPLTVSEY